VVGTDSPPGAQLDILQNLVANTRTPRSAAAQFASDLLPIGGGLRPADPKTSAPSKGSVPWLTQAGPSGTVALAERVVASATAASLDHMNF